MAKKKKKEKKPAKAVKENKKSGSAKKQRQQEKPQKEQRTAFPSGESAILFRALSDENRIRIMNLLSGRELCASELLKSLDIVQSTMSHHMKVLTEAGLVNSRRDGKRVYYSVNQEAVGQLTLSAGAWKGR